MTTMPIFQAGRKGEKIGERMCRWRNYRMSNYHKLARTQEVTGTQVWKPRQYQANKDELVTQQEIVKYLSEKRKVHIMGQGIHPQNISADVSGPIQVNPNMGSLVFLWLGQVGFSLDSVGAQDSGRSSILTMNSWEGNGGWQKHTLLQSGRLCPVQQCLQGKEPFTLNLPTNLILWDWSNVSLSPRPYPQQCFSFTPPPPQAYMGCSPGCVENTTYQLILAKQEKSCCLCFYILLVQNETIIGFIFNLLCWKTIPSQQSPHLALLWHPSAQENAWHAGVPPAISGK